MKEVNTAIIPPLFSCLYQMHLLYLQCLRKHKYSIMHLFNNKKSKKRYYIALIKKNNSIIVVTTKTAIAKHIGISVDTIRRHLIDSSIYDTTEYTIWMDIPIYKAKKGFAVNGQPTKYH